MRVIGIHPRFAGLTSHHYNESYGLKREFERRGVEFLLLINRQASPQIVADLQARPVIDDPTFRLEWSFEERTQRFVALLQALVAPELRAGDCVLITVATQLEAHALDALADASDVNAALAQLGDPDEFLDELVADRMRARAGRTFKPGDVMAALARGAAAARATRAMILFIGGVLSKDW